MCDPGDFIDMEKVKILVVDDEGRMRKKAIDEEE